MTRIDDLISRLGAIPVITAEKAVKAKSRDFFWYSPILKEKLDHITADLVVAPRTKDELKQLLAACHALDIPVTPRGGGTGNYGQAMPLAGGVVVDMARMNAIVEMRDGVVIAEPGALIGDIDKAAREALGQELRMHPSTRETASIAGFVAGGSGGVGSIRWGMLAEAGNILRVQIMTMEEAPRLIDLTGDAINQIHHAYGTTGIITEVEMPLAPAPDWVDMLVGFADWDAAVAVGWELAGVEGIWLKELAAIQAPAPQAYFTRHRPFIAEGESVLCIMVAPNSAGPLAEFLTTRGGRIGLRSDQASADALKGLPHMYHLGWNHTTLRGLKMEPEITYLQVGLPEGREIEAVAETASRFPDEVVTHLEFTRGQGRKRMSSLPLVRFSTPERLAEIIAAFEAMGCPVWNPHAYTLEEGNRRGADAAQRALKAQYDPKGLLNPGKMIAWDQPDYRYDPGNYWEYPGIQKGEQP